MIYDVNTGMSDVHAPAATQIIVRSNAQQKPDSPPANKERSRTYTSSNAQRIDIDKFTQKLQGITRRTSTQKCAKSIRLALQSAGANVQGHPVAAADWGSTLERLGYRRISPSFDQPKKGDIYIIDRTQGHTYGHIAGYSGSGWVSDFKQTGYAVYKNANVRYSYYRLDH
ncbi:peptidoglycan amidohydrolase family protein [Acinetobacter sp. GXMZU3951]|jgi:hypothetical protein